MYKLSILSDKATNPSSHAPSKKRPGLEETEEDVCIPPSRRVSLTGDGRYAVRPKQEVQSPFAFGLGARAITGARRGLWNREDQREAKAGERCRKTGCLERCNCDAEMETTTTTGCSRSMRRTRSRESPGTDHTKAAARRSRPKAVPSEPFEMEKELGHVFISYSRQDAGSMGLVQDYLVAHQVPTWTDREVTPGTYNWTLAIESAVRQASLIVCLCSPAAKGSKWVAKELLLGLDLNKPILPVLLSADATKSIPFSVYDVQYINARNRNLQEHLPEILDHVLVLMIRQGKAAVRASKSNLSRTEVDPYIYSPSPSCDRCQQVGSPDHRQGQEDIGAEDAEDSCQQHLTIMDATGRCGATTRKDIADVPEAANRIESQSNDCRQFQELSSACTRKWWLEGSSVEENCWALNDGLDENEALEKALMEGSSVVDDCLALNDGLDENEALERALMESQKKIGAVREEFFSIAAKELQELAFKTNTIKKALGSWRQRSPPRPGRLTVQPEK